MFLITANEQELHTILAALRHYQEQAASRSDWITDIATNGGAISALDEDAIDRLCERINIDAREKPNTGRTT